MKVALSTSCLLFVLLSCTYESIAPVKTFPLREIHYNFETGEKIGEKTFEYDGRGNLIRENFSSTNGTGGNLEVVYEYDGDGNLLKQKRRYPDFTTQFWIKEFTYSNGLKLTESEYFEGVVPGGIKRFYYNGNVVPDSSVIFSQYAGYTALYSYDNAGHLIMETIRGRVGHVEYAYNGDNLVSTCNVNPGYGDAMYRSCIVNEYDRNGQVTKISYEVPSNFNQLQEELFYRSGKLDEKRVYTYPGYDPNNTVDVTQVKFEY